MLHRTVSAAVRSSTLSSRLLLAWLSALWVIGVSLYIALTVGWPFREDSFWVLETSSGSLHTLSNWGIGGVLAALVLVPPAIIAGITAAVKWIRTSRVDQSNGNRSSV